LDFTALFGNQESNKVEDEFLYCHRWIE